MRLTLVEPYPRPFLADVPGIGDVRVEQVQETPLELFAELGPGDVLLVDTSHAVKTGGDVTWIFNQVLPRLRPGVVVHVHDIFLPGDYPRKWLFEGWNWSEQYLLQSVLAFNSAWEVLFGTQWMTIRHPELLQEAFPGLADPEVLSRPGASFWIRRGDR